MQIPRGCHALRVESMCSVLKKTLLSSANNFRASRVTADGTPVWKEKKARMMLKVWQHWMSDGTFKLPFAVTRPLKSRLESGRSELVG